MKNYFESDGWVFPFEKVLYTQKIGDNPTMAYYGLNENEGFPVMSNQLEPYKQWLDMKQQALINQAYKLETIYSKPEELFKNIDDEEKIMVGISSNQTKPEITPELIDFLADEFAMGSPCSICKHKDEDICNYDECSFKPDTEKFVKLNKKWQEKK